MSEQRTTELVKVKEPVIRFGPDDDSAKKVKNVRIVFKNGDEWDIKNGQHETNYDRITITKSCNEVYLMFYVNDNELSNDMFIPIHNIQRIMVDHILKPKVTTK